VSQIFISYSRANQVFAEALRTKLQSGGYATWIDIDNIPAGATWPDEIDSGLRASDLIVGVMSPDAVASRNVKNEWDWAIVNNKRLILLMLETCSVPMNYISINYIDFRSDHETGFTRLNKALLIDEPLPPADIYGDYLTALYNRINSLLGQVIIAPPSGGEREPIHLEAERTDNAVDALFEKRVEIDPFYTSMGIGAPEIEAPHEFTEFAKAFEYYKGRVLLLGAPGAGKTVTLLHFARDMIVRRRRDASQPIPILGTIATWDYAKQTPIADWLANSYGAPPDTRQLIASGKALLLLDGLDELGGESPVDVQKPEGEKYDPRLRFVQQLGEVLKPSPNCCTNGILVTCHPSDYEQIGAKIALNGAVTLKPLDKSQIATYLGMQPELVAALESDENLRDLLKTPLLLSYFAFAYEDMTPAERAELTHLQDSGDLRDKIFSRYMEKRYQYEELKHKRRGEKMPFTLAEMKEWLGRLAMGNTDWRKTENIFSLGDVQGALPHFAIVDLAIELHYIALAGHDGENNIWRFIHLLLRDYLIYDFSIVHLKDQNEYENTVVAPSPAKALGKIRDKRAFGPLIQVLDSPNKLLREAAVDALAELSDRRAVHDLIQVLSDEDIFVRAASAEALGKLGDRRAVEPLILALDDPDVRVYRSVAEALGKLGDERAVNVLIQVLKFGNLLYAAHAANVLERIGTPDALAAVAEWRKQRKGDDEPQK
jgi:hypothetical protein